jgi:hypothetical protein
MERLLKSTLVLSVLLVGIFSCKKLDLKKLASTEWNPDLAIPLAHSTFDVYDIFAHTNHNDIVVIDPNTGFIALVYKSDIATIDGEQFVTISDYTSTKNFSTTSLGGVASPSFNSTLTTNDSEDFSFSFNNGAQIKEFKFDAGNFDLNISSSFKHPIILTISIPSLTKNGNPFSKTINVSPASGGGNSTAVSNEDLTGYIADLTLNNNTVNKLQVNYAVTLAGNGSALGASDNIAINASFNTMKMDYAKGYFGQQTLNLNRDSVLLKIYQSTQDGVFQLVDPKVRFFIQNSFGMPLTLNLNQVQSINTHTGQVLNLLGYAQQIPLNVPTVIGDSALTTIQFDKTNTANIIQVVSPAPKYFSFNANAVTNPSGNLGVDNFVSKKSRVKVSTEVELPLYGMAHSFRIRDTTKFTSPGEAKYLKSVMFRLIVVNGFPINVFSKIRFLDENYQEVFVLTDDQKMLVEAALVNSAGDVTQSVKKITDLLLTESQIALLDHVKNLEIYAEANTKDFANGQNVKIYDYYKLDLRLGVQFETKVKL